MSGLDDRCVTCQVKMTEFGVTCQNKMTDDGVTCQD